MGWYLNRALTTLRNEVNARWPDRDKTSDGTIGDQAHQATASDHNPDRDGSVDAWDMDVDGVDVWHIIDRFEEHEAARYWIYNGMIASRSSGWVRVKYTGSNPHDKHVHFNTREEFEDSTKPWGIEEVDMPTAGEIAAEVWKGGGPQQLLHRVEALLSLRPTVTYPGGKTEPNEFAAAVRDDAARDRLSLAAIQALADAGGTDAEPIIAEIRAARDELRAAAAAAAIRDAQLLTLVEKVNTGEMTAGQVVDELARRLAAGGE